MFRQHFQSLRVEQGSSKATSFIFDELLRGKMAFGLIAESNRVHSRSYEIVFMQILSYQKMMLLVLLLELMSVVFPFHFRVCQEKKRGREREDRQTKIENDF